MSSTLCRVRRLCAFVLPLYFIRDPALGLAATSCEERIDRRSAVACAIQTGLGIRAASAEQDASRARVDVAAVVLPSNPEVDFSAARRSAGSASALNWALSLSQTIEIGGQRGARVDVAEHQLRASTASLRFSKQHAAASGLIAYFRALSADEHLRIADRLASVAEALTHVAEGRAKQGVAPPIDAEVAYAAGIQLLRARAQAVERNEVERSSLAITAGLNPEARPALAGDLAPIPLEDDSLAELFREAEENRPELLALGAEISAAKARIELLERERYPNLTLSAFAQQDGVGELVFGGGSARSKAKSSYAEPRLKRDSRSSHCSTRIAYAMTRTSSYPSRRR